MKITDVNDFILYNNNDDLSYGRCSMSFGDLTVTTLNIDILYWIYENSCIFKIYSCTGQIQIQSNDELVKYEVLEVPIDGIIQPFICGNDIPETARCSSDNFTSEVISESFDDISENETLDIKPSKRIIGGTINKTNKFPWVVEMIFTNENRESFVCGAAIYSSTVLITGISYT